MTVVSVAAAVFRSTLSFRACAAGVGIRSFKASPQGEAFLRNSKQLDKPEFEEMK